MTDDVLKKLYLPLQRAYPNGKSEDLDETGLRSREEWNREVAALRVAREEACLHATPVWQESRNTEVAYTLVETMPFGDWLNWDHPLRLGWLAANDLSAEGFGVLWLKLSKVAPFYSINFNTWREQGTEGRVLTEIREVDELTLRWREAISILNEGAARAGLVYWKREWNAQLHPTITEIDWDHPRLSNEAADAKVENHPRRPAQLWHLIFGNP